MTERRVLSVLADFLAWLRPGGPWVLTAINPDGPGIETVTVSSVEEIDAFVSQWNGIRNLYYTPNRVRRAMNSKPKKTDIEYIEFVLADLDPADGETPAAAQARYLPLFGEYKLGVSSINNSGNGLNALWRLRDPILVTYTTGPKGETVLTGDAAKVEAISKRIMEKMGSDAGTQNIDRILRLPGTTNLPNAAKRAKGRVVCEAAVHTIIGTAYALEDFPLADETADTTKKKSKGTGKKKTAGKAESPEPEGTINWAEVDRLLQGPDALPDGIGAKGRLILGWTASFKELNHELLAKGLLVKAYGSWSDVSFGLAASLKSDGLSKEAVAALLLRDRHCNQHQHRQEDPRRAVARAVLRSYEPETPGVYSVIKGTLWCQKADGGRFCIANFAPSILEEVTVDDGTPKTMKIWRMAATDEDGVVLPTVDVPVDELAVLQWWLKTWGASARVNVGGQVHLIPAAQALSTWTARTVHAHLGWKKIGGDWLYLHAEAAIGATGPVDGIEVGVSGRLAECVLPVVGDLKAAVQASLAMLDLGAPGVVAAAATFRAPLGAFAKIGHSVFMTGPTGVLKSAVAGVMQAHWGTAFRGDHLPDNWTSTANSLERVCFAAKDMLVVIDDFAPRGTPIDVQKLHKDADRLLRGAADEAGRGRMMADTTLRPTYYPRGLVVATGEDLPRGESLRARIFVQHLAAGDIAIEPLTGLQRAGRDGLLAQAMAGYVQWLAARAQGLPGELAARLEELRPAARRACTKGAKDGHLRSPENLVSMGLGLSTMLQFALDVGAIDEVEHRRRWNAGWLALMANDQRGGLAEENAVEQFVDLIGAALASGRAHVATPNSEPPPGCEAVCGWQRWRPSYSNEWTPQGPRIGWLIDDLVYLEPATAYAAAEGLAKAEGRSLALNPATLGRRLKEAGLLEQTGGDNKHATRQIRVADGRPRVYVMKAADVLQPVEEESEAAKQKKADAVAKIMAAANLPGGGVKSQK